MWAARALALNQALLFKARKHSEHRCNCEFFRIGAKCRELIAKVVRGERFCGIPQQIHDGTF
ncbi:hypothetical protein D3C74_438900 [compost metagenome]